MTSVTLQNQNSQATTSQMPFDNSLEAINGVVGKRRYKFPVELQGVVREEDWEFMDQQQQIALIKTLGKDPEQFLVDIIKDQSGMNMVRNVPEGFDEIEQMVTQTIIPATPRPAEVQPQNVNAVTPVRLENVSTAFNNVRQEVINEEQKFQNGSANRVEVGNTSTVEQPQPSIEKPQATARPEQRPVILTDEEKARIQVESGGSVGWMPKLFGYKPSVSTVTKVTNNPQDDSKIDASNAESWLELLLRKLFNKASQAGNI